MSDLLTRLRRRVERLERPRPQGPAPSVEALPEWSARFLLAKTDAGLSPLSPGCEFHRWLSGELDGLHARRGSRLNVLAPRSSAKTTWSSFAYPLREALHYREPYIILTSDTSDQAKGLLRGIRQELEANERLLEAYPRAAGKGPVWRDDLIQLRNGAVIQALGTGAKIRGRKSGPYRPTLILCDDPQNKDHIISALQRDRSWQWLMQDVCNAGDPQTNIVVLGTALHRECIVCRLQTTPGWRSRVWKAIQTWPARTDLWKQWQDIFCDYDLPDDEREAKARAFYEANRKEMDA